MPEGIEPSRTEPGVLPHALGDSRHDLPDGQSRFLELGGSLLAFLSPFVFGYGALVCLDPLEAILILEPWIIAAPCALWAGGFLVAQVVFRTLRPSPRSLSMVALAAFPLAFVLVFGPKDWAQTLDARGGYALALAYRAEILLFAIPFIGCSIFRAPRPAAAPVAAMSEIAGSGKAGSVGSQSAWTVDLALASLWTGASLLGLIFQDSALEAYHRYWILPTLEDIANTSPRRQNIAIVTMGSLGRGAAPAVPQLTAYLADDTTSNDLHAATALGQIGASAVLAIPVLERVARESTDPMTRSAALISVDQIRFPRESEEP